MSRLIKITKYIAISLGSLLGLLLLSTILLLKNSYVQNKITAYVTDYLSAQFKTNIRIGHISYHPFTNLSLDDVYFGDHKNDTLFYVEHLKLNIGGFDKDSLQLTLTDVSVDGGLCKITTYQDSSFNIHVLFNIQSTDTTPSPVPFKLLMSHVNVINSRFRFINLLEPQGGAGFNPFDEDFYNVSLNADDFWIIKDSLNLKLHDLSCMERGGAEVKKIDCNAIIASTGMWFNELDVAMCHSDIKGSYSMTYNSWDEMADFNRTVYLSADLKKSKIDMRDVSDFAPPLSGWDQIAYLSGKVQGTVDNLKGRNIILTTGRKTIFRGNVSLTGLPEIDETFMDAQVEEIRSDRKDIEYISRQKMPDMIEKFGDIRFNGAYTGFVKDFVAYGQFTTDVGDVYSDFNIKLADNLSQTAYKGSIELIGLDAGTLFDYSGIGHVSLTTQLDGKGFSLADLDTRIGFDVSYFYAANYQFKNVSSTGVLKNKIYEGKLVSKDPNALFDFAGKIDLSNDIPHYEFDSKIDYVNFKNLSLIDSSNVTLGADLHMNFSYKDIDHNSGSVEIKDIVLLKNGKDLDVKKVSLFTTSDGYNREIAVNTDYAKLRINGEYSFLQLPDNMYHLMHLLAPAYFDKKVKLPNKQNFNFKLDVIKASIFNELFLPNIDANNLHVNGNLNSQTNSLEVSVNAGFMRYHNWNVLQIALNAKAENGKKAAFSGGIQQLKNRDTILFTGMSIYGNLEDNHSGFALTVADSTGVATGKILSDIEFTQEQISLMFDTSYLVFRGAKFDLQRGGNIAYHHSTFEFDSIVITSAKEDVFVNGYYSFINGYNIKAEIVRLNLDLINLFDQKQNIAYKGNANGTFIIKEKNGASNIDALLHINTLVLDNDTIGDLVINSEYNDVQKRMMVFAKTLSGKLKSLETSGYIDMKSSPYALHLNVSFAESDLKSFQAFLKEQVHITSGTVQAKCNIDGTLNDLKVNGKIDVNNAVARVEYLKTIYRFSSGILFTGSEIEIPAFDLFDVNNRKAVLSGKISHRSFSNFNYRIMINQLQKFQVLNTTANDNNLYYGVGYVSGKVSFIGPQTALLMEGNVKTEKGTVFNIPLSESTGEGSSIITFVNRDTNVTVANLVKQEKLFGFEMNTILNITPDAEINIVFDADKEDKISGTGEGVLKMEMTKQGLFNMYGEVKINKGEYKFTALDFFVKKFNLKSGSSIVWSGDPLQARMDITGSYSVRRTSVANILVGISQTQIEEARKQRMPAECLMYISGSLQSPQYKFDLSFPEIQGILSASTATVLENSLNRLRAEPQQMEQQVINLILFGNFLPMEGVQQFGGNTSLSSGLNNTLSDIVSAQASNFIDKIVPGLDVNVDVSRNDQQNWQTIFSASKKLLNDRLEVQGSYSLNNNTNSSNNTNNSIMTQYDLDKNGNLKLRAYSRSITDPTGISYNRQINTQGFGLFFRKEFNSFFKKKNETPKDTTSVSVNSY